MPLLLVSRLFLKFSLDFSYPSFLTHRNKLFEIKRSKFSTVQLPAGTQKRSKRKAPSGSSRTVLFSKVCSRVDAFSAAETVQSVLSQDVAERIGRVQQRMLMAEGNFLLCSFFMNARCVDLAESCLVVSISQWTLALLSVCKTSRVLQDASGTNGSTSRESEIRSANCSEIAAKDTKSNSRLGRLVSSVGTLASIEPSEVKSDLGSVRLTPARCANGFARALLKAGQLYELQGDARAANYYFGRSRALCITV